MALNGLFGFDSRTALAERRYKNKVKANMQNRLYVTALLTALLILTIAGSAMCTPTELPDQAATQAEQKAIDAIQKAIDAKGYNWTAGMTSVSGLTLAEKKKMCGIRYKTNK
jgi:hypothetical protein